MNVPTTPEIQKLDRAIVKLEAQLADKQAERNALIEQLMDEARQTLQALAGLRSTKGTERKPYTGRKRGVAPGQRPILPTKFSDEQIQDIREAYDTGTKQGALAEQYGIAQPTVHKIVNRQTYTYVPERVSVNGTVKA